MAIWSAEIKELERLYGSHRGKLPELEKELELLIKADSSGKYKLSRKELYYYIFGDKYLNTCIPHGISSTSSTQDDTKHKKNFYFHDFKV